MKTDLKRKIIKGVIISVIAIVIFFIVFLSIQSCQNSNKVTKLLEIEKEIDQKMFEVIKALQEYDIDTFVNVILDIEDLKEKYDVNKSDIETIKDDMNKINVDANDKYEANKGRIDKIWKALFE